MKKVTVLFACAVLLVGLAAYLKAGDQDFVLMNETGVTIDELYISPVSTNEWEEDVLGVDTLPSGEDVTITFPHDADECQWDMKIKDENGNEFVWQGIDLCKTGYVVLHYENGKAWATYEK